MKSIGTFEVENGKVVVSDPCYERGTWCAGTLDNVLNGTWTARVKMSDEGEWGMRVARLVVMHESANQRAYDITKWEQEGFQVGVDSGQAGIFDTKHFKRDADATGLERMSDDVIRPEDPWYSMCCDRTLCDESAGVIPFGAVSSSGYGDGGYPCFAKRDGKGRVIGIGIMFIRT